MRRVRLVVSIFAVLFLVAFWYPARDAVVMLVFATPVLLPLSLYAAFCVER